MCLILVHMILITSESQVIIEINQTFNHFISKGCEKHFVTAGSFLKGYLVMWKK